MSEFIINAEQLTPERLTDLLRAHGTLPQGAVIRAEQELATSEQAELVHLTLRYAPDAPPNAPRHLFAKLARHDRDYPGYAAVSPSEVLFYRVFAPAIGAPPLVRCYAAEYDPLRQRSYLLLEDIAETHGAPRFPDEWPLPPPYAQIERVVDALSACHAACWNHPRLGDLPSSYPTQACSPLSIVRGTQNYTQFADALGDRLSQTTRRLFEQALAAYPTLDRRMADRQHLTVIHGDFLYGNVLLPRDPQHELVRIVDWELCSVNLGTFDLAEILSLHWDAGLKSERERELVRRYHMGLLAHGVAGYSWDQCWYDYRLELINHLFTPIQQWADRHWPGNWWGRMERTLKRFDDLDCAELL